MTLCLRCFRLSPSGSLYCTTCGTALGVRYCENNHPSPLRGQHCRICGSCTLSEGTPALSLRPVTFLLSLFLLLLCWRWLIVHPDQTIHGIWRAARYLFGVVMMGSDARLADRLIRWALGWIFTGWVIGWMLYWFFPGNKGGRTGELLRSLPPSVLRCAWPLALLLLHWTLRGIGKLFFGALRAAKKEEGGK